MKSSAKILLIDQVDSAEWPCPNGFNECQSSKQNLMKIYWSSRWVIKNETFTQNTSFLNGMSLLIEVFDRSVTFNEENFVSG